MSTCLHRRNPLTTAPLGLLAAAAPPHAEHAAMANVRWPNGSVIRLGFIQPADSFGKRIRQALQAAANQWSGYANLVFTIQEGGSGADVTVQTAETADASFGTYSAYLGTENLAVSGSGQPAMHLVFDPTDEGNTDAELQRVTLHELGHVLGLIHEHERPDKPILWNQIAVYRYYHKMTGWSWQDIKEQVLDPYSEPLLAVTAFDPLSIMMYPFPVGLAEYTDGSPFSSGWNLTLTERDKAIAAAMYPFPGHAQ
jgi:serralysin